MGDALTEGGNAPRGRNWMHVGGGYTTVDNRIFRERALSARAKGIYCQVRSAEANPSWQFTIAGIAACVADSEYATRKALKELERAGFLLRAQRRRTDGTFACAAENVWITLDDPSLFKAAAKRAAAEGLNIISARTRHAGCALQQRGADPTGTAHPKAAQAASAEPCAKAAQADLPTPSPGAASGCAGDHGAPPSPDDLAAERVTQGARADRCLERLLSLSLKPVAPRSRPAVQAAWDEAMASGTDPEAVLAAYEAYVAAYEEANGSELRYAKRLERWLAEGDGMAHWLRRVERERREDAGSAKRLSDVEMRALRRTSPEAQQAALAGIDPVYRAMCEEMDALKEERPSGWRERADALMWQARARFCASSKKIARALMQAQSCAAAIG